MLQVYLLTAVIVCLKCCQSASDLHSMLYLNASSVYKDGGNLWHLAHLKFAAHFPDLIILCLLISSWWFWLLLFLFLTSEHYELWVIPLCKVSSIAALYKVCIKSLLKSPHHLSFSQWDRAEPLGLLGMQVCEGRHWDWAQESVVASVSCPLNIKVGSGFAFEVTLWLFTLHSYREQTMLLSLYELLAGALNHAALISVHEMRSTWMTRSIGTRSGASR